MRISEIASQFDILGNRVRQICEKIFRRPKGHMAASVERAASSEVVEAESKKLRDENEEFRINSALAKEGKPKTVQQGFKTPLTELGFGRRLLNSFSNYNIHTIADLKQMNTMDVIWLPNVGRKSIGELETIVEKYSIGVGW